MSFDKWLASPLTLDQPAKPAKGTRSAASQPAKPRKAAPGAASAKRIKELEAALAKADELCRVALPQFNWAASALDGQAISILNEAPGIIHRALLKETDR